MDDMTMGENEHMAYKIQYRYFHDYYLGCTYSGVEREPVVTTDIHALVCVCVQARWSSWLSVWLRVRMLRM